MVVARDSDFLGEGTADQGQARPLSLYEQARLEEDERMRRLLEARRNRLGLAGGRLGTSSPGSGAQSFSRSINPRTGRPYDEEAQPGSGSGWDEFLGSVGPTAKAISKDPVTAGVLLAPYGVVGAGLAVGGGAALTGGTGAGTLAGGAAPAGVPAVTPLGSMASPFGPGTLAGKGAAAGAASPGAAAAAAPGASAAKDAWTWKDTVRTAAPLASWGLSTIAEHFIRGSGDDERRKLQEKQEQIARETELRRQQQQQARMDALGNRMLAFDSYNQHLARMFGPQAAFKPEQLAALVENPMKPELDPELMNYTGTDDKKEKKIRDYMAAREKYDAAEEARRNKVMGGITPLPAAPAAFNMPAPLPGKRY